MEGTLFILFTLPVLSLCSGEGNIHLLEDEVAAALKSCSQIQEYGKNNDKRQRRSTNELNSYEYNTARIDANNKQEVNPYNHIRRNNSFLNQIYILNDTNYNFSGYNVGTNGEKFVKSVPKLALGNTNLTNNNAGYRKVKRNEPLLSKDDNDQCLSQCVFANLQMVDSQGIPREADMWNKVQTTLASQQSRVLLRDQIRACFQELQSESEDNGCSYSNKLERCLMLRFADRKINGTRTTSQA